ncbi:ribosome silencing factor [Neolewinella antarctica]|uniref:Ribosomal silencing factor RsfS n=1 Tax=Neolewinella antarctica TaxID=442734 RepID=A0ABX0X9V4_9BACT|nr:ribosome silencing factor [Neolewinella antarctica]NJC26021.1 ribosome-associated protein [Neolewinella antarctica]
MNTSTNISASDNTSEKMAQRLDVIVDAMQDIKAKKIIKIDLRKLHDRPTDFFVICEGESVTQVASIADNIQNRLKREIGEYPKSVNSGTVAKWVCMDYFDTIVHVFYPETRAFYEMEDLWSDGEFVRYEDA